MPVLAANKRAGFDYEFLETFEAGLMLLGHEVKAVKAGRASLAGAFVTIRSKARPELYLTNASISRYAKAASIGDYDPTRPRKLLLKRQQIDSLVGKARTNGLTLVPIKVYTVRNLIKLEFALARGKKQYDKRETIKKRDVERQIRTAMKHR